MFRIAFVSHVMALLLVSSAARAADRWAADNEPSEPTVRKIHVRDVEVHACIPTSAEALRIRINEQVRPDILKERGLAYEDISAYKEVTKWNPEEFNVQETENALRVLGKLDIKKVLWFSLSCLPTAASAPPRYLLAAKLTDVDAVNAILSCPDAQAGVRNGRRVCHVGGNVFDAVSFASVEIDSFDGFKAAVRTLLSRLLHVPEVGFGSTQAVSDPGEEVSLPFLVRHNDGTESGYNGAQAERRTYYLAQDVVEIPHDLGDQVCQEPHERWAQISCGAGFNHHDCDRADVISFSARSLIHQRVVAAPPGAREGGDRITFRAASHAQTYLVRAEVIAQERGGEVRSIPIYRCLRVKMRPYYVGFVARLGAPYDLGGAGERFPEAGLLAPAVGFDIEFVKHLYGFEGAWLSTIRGALVLGYTSLSGTYPCPARDFPKCTLGSSIGHFAGKIHFAQSATGELRVSFRPEIVRIWKASARVVADVGFGVESLHTSSGDAFKNDGVYGVLIGGVGGALGFSSILGVSTWAGEASIGMMWQTRTRFSSAVVSRPATERDSNYIDGPGVPDALGATWFFVQSAFTP